MILREITKNYKHLQLQKHYICNYICNYKNYKTVTVRIKRFYEKSVIAVIPRAIRHYAETRDKYIYDCDE